VNPVSLDCGFTSEVIPICHFFGTRQLPVGLQGSIHLGEVTAGPSSFPFIASLKQIHSTRVAVFDRPVKAEVMAQGEGDALVTNQPQLLLVVRTADCVPVLLVDKIGVIGAMHAGWRGAVGGIVSKTIQACVEHFGSNAAHMHVAIGPSIGPCCYEIDAQVVEPLQTRYPHWPGVLQETREGKAMLDLKKLIWHQILASGIPEQHIERIEECTRCRDDLFFSYRREGKVNGTMMSGIMLPER
jgi:purine-nucleoside/S-methyl-5'-thioadenosine phosphorylase / adenosine deaminase